MSRRFEIAGEAAKSTVKFKLEVEESSGDLNLLVVGEDGEEWVIAFIKQSDGRLYRAGSNPDRLDLALDDAGRIKQGD